MLGPLQPLLNLYAYIFSASLQAALTILTLFEVSSLKLAGAAVGSVQGLLQETLPALRQVTSRPSELSRTTSETSDVSESLMTRTLTLLPAEYLPNWLKREGSIEPDLPTEDLHPADLQRAQRYVDTADDRTDRDLPDYLYTQFTAIMDRVLDLRHRTSAMLHREEEVMPGEVIAPRSGAASARPSLKPLPEHHTLSRENSDRRVGEAPRGLAEAGLPAEESPRAEAARPGADVMPQAHPRVTVERMGAAAGDETPLRRTSTKQEHERELVGEEVGRGGGEGLIGGLASGAGSVVRGSEEAPLEAATPAVAEGAPAGSTKMPAPASEAAQAAPEQPQQLGPTAATAPGTPPAAAMAEGPSAPAAAAVGSTPQPEAPTSPAGPAAPAAPAAPTALTPETKPAGVGAPPAAGPEIVPEAPTTAPAAPAAAGEAGVAMPATPGRAPSSYYTPPPSPLPGTATPAEPYSPAGSVTSTESKKKKRGFMSKLKKALAPPPGIYG